MARIVGIFLVLSLAAAGCADNRSNETTVIAGDSTADEQTETTSTTITTSPMPSTSSTSSTPTSSTPTLSSSTTTATATEVPDSLVFREDDVEWTEARLLAATVSPADVANERWVFEEPELSSETVSDFLVELDDSCAAEHFDAELFGGQSSLSATVDSGYATNIPWVGTQTIAVMGSEQRASAAVSTLGTWVGCAFDAWGSSYEPDPDDENPLSDWYQVDVIEHDIDGASGAIVIDFASISTGRFRFGLAAIGELLVAVVLVAPGFSATVVLYEAGLGQHPDLVAQSGLDDEGVEQFRRETEAYGFDGIDDVAPNMEDFFEAAVISIRAES